MSSNLKDHVLKGEKLFWKHLQKCLSIWRIMCLRGYKLFKTLQKSLSMRKIIGLMGYNLSETFSKMSTNLKDHRINGVKTFWNLSKNVYQCEGSCTKGGINFLKLVQEPLKKCLSMWRIVCLRNEAVNKTAWRRQTNYTCHLASSARIYHQVQHSCCQGASYSQLFDISVTFAGFRYQRSNAKLSKLCPHPFFRNSNRPIIQMLHLLSASPPIGRSSLCILQNKLRPLRCSDK